MVDLVGHVQHPVRRVVAQPRVTGGDDRRERGHRPTRRENALCFRREADDVAEPAGHACLDGGEPGRERGDGRVPVDGECHELGDGGPGQAAAGDVGHVARPRGVDGDVGGVADQREEVGERAAFLRRRCQQRVDEVVGAVEVNGGRGGTPADEVDDEVERGAAKVVKLVGRGLERQAATFGHCGHTWCARRGKKS